MSKICDVCGKGYLKANKVPRGIGNRVTNRSIIRRGPNLRSKRVVIDGTPLKIKICSSCLKRMNYEKKKAIISATAGESVTSSN